MSTRVPLVFAGLVDDASIVPPRTTPIPDALSRYREHTRSWYADAVGPLLVPASRVAEVGAHIGDDRLSVGIIGDTGPAPHGLHQVTQAIDMARTAMRIRHVEISVGMRGDDPLPGLQSVLETDRVLNGRGLSDFINIYAEIPLTWGVLASLDRLAAARAEGAMTAAKFRIGGLAAELFPTPVELAAIICACRDRALPFKVTPGPRRAIRQTDPDTGLVNHGFLNILAAVLVATQGAEAADLVEYLGGLDAQPLVEVVRGHMKKGRDLWRGFGGYRLMESIADLRTLGLLTAPPLTIS